MVFAALNVLLSTGFERIISLSFKSNNTDEKSDIKVVIIMNITIPNTKLI